VHEKRRSEWVGSSQEARQCPPTCKYGNDQRYSDGPILSEFGSTWLARGLKPGVDAGDVTDASAGGVVGAVAVAGAAGGDAAAPDAGAKNALTSSMALK
jgi:hypothetical protein